MIEKEAEFLASHSHTAEALFKFGRQVDHEVKKATGNTVDLKVLTPLALAIAVFLELGASAATPVWLTLGLFSFNHFVELHTHPADGNHDHQPDLKPRTKPLHFP
jgi:hypothetical protein